MGVWTLVFAVVGLLSVHCATEENELGTELTQSVDELAKEIPADGISIQNTGTIEKEGSDDTEGESEKENLKEETNEKGYGDQVVAPVVDTSANSADNDTIDTGGDKDEETAVDRVAPVGADSEEDSNENDGSTGEHKSIDDTPDGDEVSSGDSDSQQANNTKEDTGEMPKSDKNDLEKNEDNPNTSEQQNNEESGDKPNTSEKQNKEESGDKHDTSEQQNKEEGGDKSDDNEAEKAVDKPEDKPEDKPVDITEGKHEAKEDGYTDEILRFKDTPDIPRGPNISFLSVFVMASVVLLLCYVGYFYRRKLGRLIGGGRSDIHYIPLRTMQEKAANN